jgi:hypothetical protein
MPASPVNQYLTLTLRALGFDTFDSNLLSIPTQVWTIINMLIFTWICAYTLMFTILLDITDSPS